MLQCENIYSNWGLIPFQSKFIFLLLWAFLIYFSWIKGISVGLLCEGNIIQQFIFIKLNFESDLWSLTTRTKERINQKLFYHWILQAKYHGGSLWRKSIIYFIPFHQNHLVLKINLRGMVWVKEKYLRQYMFLK